MSLLNSIGFQIGVRLCVFITSLIFINIMERNFYRAGVRGGLERIFELIAAFVMGIVLRGIIILIRNI